MTVSEKPLCRAFRAYMDHGGHHVTRRQYIENLTVKMQNQEFRSDVGPLLAARVTWDIEPMAELVSETLIARLPEF